MPTDNRNARFLGWPWGTWYSPSSLACWALVLGWLAADQSIVRSQTPDLPRLEYYVARDLYDAGNVSEATEGFRTAVSRGQNVKNQRWIDAVPPLVMLGECYYQEGAIALALEQYDAALTVVLTFPNWADVIRGADVTQEPPAETRGIVWAKQSRKLPLARVPSVMQVPLDPSAVRVGAAGNLTSSGTTITRLDVCEVLRCLSIALRRRVELLGPLVRYSPMTQPTIDYFAKPPAADNPWVQSGWQALHGMALAATDEALAVTKLSAGASIDNKADYCLTAPCLLSLAALDVQQGNAPAAIARLSDASLRAAQLEQTDTVAECFTMLGQVASANRRTDLLPMLQAAAQWSQNSSMLAYLASSGAICELSGLAGNIQVHEAASKQMLALLSGQAQGQSIALPRVQAHLGYAMARVAALQNRLPLAEQQLETSLSLLRGNPLTGAASARSFQTQLTVELVTRGNLAVADADAVFAQLLAEPSVAQWRRSPLECFVSISMSQQAAFAKWLEIASRRGDAADIVARMDAAQRQRWCETLPLGGRLLAIRQALHTDRSQWPKSLAEQIEPLFKHHAAARSLPGALREALEALQREPLATDDRTLSAESKKRLGELNKLAEAEENLVMGLALERAPLSRAWPDAVTLSDIQQQLTDSDVVISYVHTPTVIYGAAISRTSQHVWTVAESQQVDAKIARLLTQMGVGGAPDLDVGPANLAWRLTAAELSKQLLSPEARQMATKSQRVVIVPSGNLWYLPFDLLPLSESDTKTPMLARQAVCYLPLLAHVRKLNQPAPPVRSTLGIVQALFNSDRTINGSLCNQVGIDLSQSARVDGVAKGVLATPAWIRLRADQLWVAGELPMGNTPWELRVVPMEPSRDNALANWMQSPLRSPSRVLLPGMVTSAQRAELKGGNELFVPACTFMASGVRAAWLSRWKVGGRSSHALLCRVIDELELDRPSSAWQRAAIALWADKLSTGEEPVLPSAKGLPPTVDGSHPLFWSGYLMVGDTQSP